MQQKGNHSRAQTPKRDFSGTAIELYVIFFNTRKLVHVHVHVHVQVHVG